MDASLRFAEDNARGYHHVCLGCMLAYGWFQLVAGSRASQSGPFFVLFLLLVVYSQYPGLEQRCREFLHSSRVVTPVPRLNYRRLIASLDECLGACLCTHVCQNSAGS